MWSLVAAFLSDTDGRQTVVADLFDRPQHGERAVLVRMHGAADDEIDNLQEFIDLAEAAGAEVLEVVTGTSRHIDARLFVGSGKAEEIDLLVKNEEAELVIFDHALSPAQERNLEQMFECRVLDRSGLILDIFAQRARSFEGKLQVELAQLRHMSTRLVRGWTHLERQKGGIGLRGPGETQLETDRRLLNQRIDQIKKRLSRVASQRNQSRKSRTRAEVPTISLVGYTNAGKSTLFNRLTEANVYVKDQLFATLDPTLRKLHLPSGNTVILADTVGFVSRLPHELVAAFKSTLQETVEADLLLHVVDAASHNRAENMAEVNAVLAEIGADKVPVIEVFNKIDLMEQAVAKVDRDEDGNATSVWCSAGAGIGQELLLDVLESYFHQDSIDLSFDIGPEAGKLRATFYEVGQVLEEQPCEAGGWQMRVRLLTRDYDRFVKNGLISAVDPAA